MNLVYDFWTDKEYSEFLEYLFTLSDKKYKNFQLGLLPGVKGMIGVRMPILRKLAKEILKGNWRSFLEMCTTNHYEEIMMKGIVIGYSNITLIEYTHWIDNFTVLINNWAICDSFCTSLKGIHNYPDEIWLYLDSLLTSKNPWQVRVGIVIMINYYLDSKYISACLSRIDKIKMEHYYVKMAQAWLISIAYIKFPDITYDYLLESTLDNWTFNKAIQKTRESLKVSKEDKEMLNALKRK